MILIKEQGLTSQYSQAEEAVRKSKTILFLFQHSLDWLTLAQQK
jgi:hypothetical protein